MLVYLAAQLLPVVSPPLPGGAVAVDSGRIVACGLRDRVLAAAGEEAQVRDLGQVVLMPGLVNCHTHLELSWAADEPAPPENYVAWLRRLLELRPSVSPERERAAALRTLDRLVAGGTVAVGDVANETWIAPMMAESGLYGTIFHEVLGTRPAAVEEVLEAADTRLAHVRRLDAVRSAAHRLQLVPSPHAPHTVSEPLLRALARRARASDRPLSIHVAESEAETILLRDGDGPLAALFDERGFRDADWRAPGRTPVEQLHRAGALFSRTLAVHCVRVGATDRALLSAAGVTVVACPRSNERLGVGQPPLAELLRDGVRVALGTDSLASAPDIDLFAEMAALRRLHTGISSEAVVRMATLEGARALGLADRLGSIQPGHLARLVAVPLSQPDTDPLDAVCAGPACVHPLERSPWTAPA